VSLLPEECSAHTVISQPARRVTAPGERSLSCSYGGSACDDELATGWYRFDDDGFNFLSEAVVGVYRCGVAVTGTLAPGGTHPTMAERTKQLDLCFTGAMATCESSGAFGGSGTATVGVTNCGAYFVYRLGPVIGFTGDHNLGYCTTDVAPAAYAVAPQPPACAYGDVLTSIGGDDGLSNLTCVSCKQQGGMLFASNGTACVAACGVGEAPGADGVACVMCGQQGLYVSSDGTECVSACSVGEAGSSDGACVSCMDQGLLVSSDANACVASCGAGEARDGVPDVNSTGWGFSNYYGYGFGFGFACQNCQQQEMVIASDGASCVYACSPGEELLAGGIACATCAQAGKRLGSDGASCVAACGIGEALVDDVACVSCSGQYVSRSGTSCVNACGAGETVSAADGYTCVACQQAGMLVGGDGYSCVAACSAGEALTADGSVCVSCASQNLYVSSDGASCVSWCANASEALDGYSYGNGYGYSYLYGDGYGQGHTCINCHQHGMYKSSSDGASCTWGCNVGEAPGGDDGYTCMVCSSQGMLVGADGSSCVSSCSAAKHWMDKTTAADTATATCMAMVTATATHASTVVSTAPSCPATAALASCSAPTANLASTTAGPHAAAFRALRRACC
jgi:hypothetical protein